MRKYPDYGKTSQSYVDGVIETMAWCSPAELAELMHPRTGIAAQCKFLPTAADIHGFLRDRRDAEAKREATYSPHTTWKRLEREADVREPDVARRVRYVLEKLGYDPRARVSASRRHKPEPQFADDLPKDSTQLKTPPRPPSQELLAQVAQKDWERARAMEALRIKAA